jgi:hypothetical protein
MTVTSDLAYGLLSEHDAGLKQPDSHYRATGEHDLPRDAGVQETASRRWPGSDRCTADTQSA